MSLIKNSIWNLAGFVIPSILAIPGMAILTRNLTVSEYGLFMLVFALIGYISIFDFGLNRAIIRFIAINENNLLKKEKILGTSILVLSSIGISLLILMYLCLDLIVGVLNIEGIKNEVVQNSLIFAIISIPFFLVTQCFTGYLEGLQKFKLLNIQKTISNSLLVLLPVVFVLIESRVDYVIMGLMIGRILNLLISFFFYLRFDRIDLKIDFSIIRDMVFFGGWITVSNIISPIMTYFDRFILSHLTNISTVGFYSVPTEIVSRMSIIHGSIAKALFPYMSSKENISKKQYFKYMFSLFLITLIFCIPFFIFGDVIVRLWVGEKYLGVSVDILKILLIGLIFNAMAQVPFTLIQASGFSKTTALIHLAELFPYLAIMIYMIFNYGIYGAAIAWVLRMIVDLFLMHYFAKKIFDSGKKNVF
ncbi:TPA: flippase [Acinetobacter baumannii]|uniref:flippase n=3 Tax=Acinetobacter baumannii TaxID=470 RepID=UPI0024B6D3F6|nr:flippase [Acinetobacter baumannii]MDI9755557.1 flippase [Acinetobacter baumannii]MEB6557859.1 flippase [Acinetobacter baumannii]HAV4963191.1 flippase [Acinetobacter baumannii]